MVNRNVQKTQWNQKLTDQFKTKLIGSIENYWTIKNKENLESKLSKII